MAKNALSRDSNIELLRIVLMLMIIMHHLIVHGSGLAELTTSSYVSTGHDAIYFLLNSFMVVAVNCFVFISGYYAIRFKLKTLVSFILQALFYSLGISLILLSLGYVNWSLFEFVKLFFPFTTVHWWFFSVYIALYIFSPILNKGVDKMNKYHLLALIVIMLYLECSYVVRGSNILADNGCSFYSFVVLYIMGRYMSKNEVKIKLPFVGYVFTCLVLFMVSYLTYSYLWQPLAWRFFSYSNPLIILGAVLLFYTFKNLKIRSSYINAISPLVFGVYLIHDEGTIRYYLKNFTAYLTSMADNIGVEVLMLLALAFAVFISCACVEKIRQLITKPALDYLFRCKKLKQLADVMSE